MLAGARGKPGIPLVGQFEITRAGAGPFPNLGHTVWNQSRLGELRGDVAKNAFQREVWIAC